MKAEIHGLQDAIGEELETILNQGTMRVGVGLIFVGVYRRFMDFSWPSVMILVGVYLLSTSIFGELIN